MFDIFNFFGMSNETKTRQMISRWVFKGICVCFGAKVSYLRDGGRRIRHPDGVETWYNPQKYLNRLDGPAVINTNGEIEYWVGGEIPITILDLLIISKDIDIDMFPSAVIVTEVKYNHHAAEYRAYRLDPHDLALAVLHYG